MIDDLAAAPLDAMRQLPLAFGGLTPQRFDNFLPGENAQWPVVSGALSEPQPGVPVYLWGLPGCGKTHLLRAAAGAAQARGGRVAAFDANTRVPWTLGEDDRLIVLDDCERYDVLQQHAAFALFVEAASAAVPVLAAGRLPPTDLALRDDLRSRLGWGLVFQLVAPTDAQVRALLQQEAHHRGIALGDDVLDHLQHRCARDLSHLMTLLDRLDRYSLAAKRSVTVPLVRQMLSAGPGWATDEADAAASVLRDPIR